MKLRKCINRYYPNPGEAVILLTYGTSVWWGETYTIAKIVNFNQVNSFEVDCSGRELQTRIQHRYRFDTMKAECLRIAIDAREQKLNAKIIRRVIKHDSSEDHIVIFETNDNYWK